VSFIKKIGLYNELKTKAENRGKPKTAYDPDKYKHTREL
jgi:hypothetical protein